MISLVLKDRALKRNLSVRANEKAEVSLAKSCNGILRFSLEKCGINHNIDSNGYCEFHKYQHDRKLNPTSPLITVSIEEARRAHAAKSRKPAKEPIKKPMVVKLPKEPKRAKDAKTAQEPKLTKVEREKALKLSHEALRLGDAMSPEELTKFVKAEREPKKREIAKLGSDERDREANSSLPKEPKRRKESKAAAAEAKLFKDERENVLRMASEAKRAKQREPVQPKAVETPVLVKEKEKEIIRGDETKKASETIPMETTTKPIEVKRVNEVKPVVDDHEKVYEPFYWDSPANDTDAEGPVWDGELEKVEWIDDPPKNGSSFVQNMRTDNSESKDIVNDNYDDFFNTNSTLRNDVVKESLSGARRSRPEKHLQFGHVTEKNKQVTQYIFRFEDLPSISPEKQKPKSTGSDPFSVEWEH
jgi:hypothetical protein